jgi:hypothetical protein
MGESVLRLYLPHPIVAVWTQWCGLLLGLVLGGWPLPFHLEWWSLLSGTECVVPWPFAIIENRLYLKFWTIINDPRYWVFYPDKMNVSSKWRTTECCVKLKRIVISCFSSTPPRAPGLFKLFVQYFIFNKEDFYKALYRFCEKIVWLEGNFGSEKILKIFVIVF